jgi:hypothetical protein
MPGPNKDEPALRRLVVQPGDRVMSVGELRGDKRR